MVKEFIEDLRTEMNRKPMEERMEEKEGELWNYSFIDFWI